MPTAEGQLTAAEVAQIYALVQAQAKIREELSRMAIAATLGPLRLLTNWYDTTEITLAVLQVLRVVQPVQVRMAQVTDAYLARVLSTMTGRPVRPLGAVDVTQLRRELTDEIADLVDREPEEIIPAGDLPLDRVFRDEEPTRRRGRERERPAGRVGPSRSAPDRGAERAVQRAVERAAQVPVRSVNPVDVYSRVAAQYRFQVSEGVSEEKAKKEALRRAESIARTDVTLAHRAQANRVMRQQDPDEIIGYRRILRPELSQTGPCGLCIVAADRVYHIEDLDPIHGNCVPAGTRVAADGVLRVTRRHYPGPLVVLGTATGEKLAITANHPVLTDKGWLPAHLVDVGDNVLRHRFGHGVVGRSPDKGDGPPLVEEVWRAATMDGALDPRVVPLAAEDFHGDGSDGEVEVVTPDRGLPRVGDVSFAQPMSESALVCRHGLRPGLSSLGGLDESLLAWGDASHGGVRGSGDGLSFFAGASLVAEVASLTRVAALHAGLLKTAGYDSPVDSVLLGEGEFRGSGAVLLDDLLVGQSVPKAPRFDPAGVEFAGEGRHAYAQLGRDLRERLAGDVELDCVVDKHWVEGPHVVFNLQTTEGWYSANNCIVSNCRCTVLPILRSSDPGLRLNDEDLQRLYKAAGGTTDGRKLKRVRAVITEHGELGPILAEAPKNPRGERRGPRKAAASKAPNRRLTPAERIPGLETSTAELRRRYLDGETRLGPAIQHQLQLLEQLRRELASA